MVDLPSRAPDWAEPLVAGLLDAGFSVVQEGHGGMAGYSLLLERGDCSAVIGGDRGDFDVRLSFPNPRRGRGYPRVKTMLAEDYLAGVRGDADASFLLGERYPETARWLSARAAEPEPLALDEDLLARISGLQRQRAHALFG
jgi:hypothetical protein